MSFLEIWHWAGSLLHRRQRRLHQHQLRVHLVHFLDLNLLNFKIWHFAKTDLPQLQLQRNRDINSSDIPLAHEIEGYTGRVKMRTRRVLPTNVRIRYALQLWRPTVICLVDGKPRPIGYCRLISINLTDHQDASRQSSAKWEHFHGRRRGGVSKATTTCLRWAPCVEEQIAKIQASGSNTEIDKPSPPDCSTSTYPPVS